MRKTFIDVGAYNGDSVEQFLNWFKIIDDVSEYEIHAFEPNKAISGGIKHLAELHDNIHFYDKAVWVHDGMVEFAVDSDKQPLGSTVESSKASIWNNNKHIMVDCIDFSEWLKQFSGYSEVVVKMDCEGAEFEILNKLLDDGTLPIITLLLVEFHQNKAIKYTSDYKNELVKKLREYIEVHEWH